MKCRTCGTTLTAGALLCGECGTSAIAPRPTLGDTARHDRRALLDAIAREGAARQSSGHQPQHAAPLAVPEPAPTSTPLHEVHTEAVPAPAPAAAPTPAATPAQAPAEAPAQPSVPAPAPSPGLDAVLVPDVAPPAEAEGSPASGRPPFDEIVFPPAERPDHHAPQHAADPAPRAPLFSLVFSTGESVRVAGSGLIGRNPIPAPDERVDYLVQIVDPHRSVSKTHLEFGVDGDTLWIADRNSANGTRFGLFLLEPIDLQPGERMRVPRGTRIGIGDQFFDVH